MLGIKKCAILPVMLFSAVTVLAMPSDDKGMATLHRGDSLYRQGNFVEAAKAYQLSAAAGNAEAQFNLAYAYYNGEGIERNYTSAAMWFKRAAKQNFAKAQYNLAYCYMNGRGVPRDYDKAASLLIQSADNNYKRAQLTLADCYSKGILVEQDEEEGHRWKMIAEDGTEKKPVDNVSVEKKPTGKKNDMKNPVEKSQPALKTTVKETLADDYSVEVDIPGMEGAETADVAPAPSCKSAPQNEQSPSSASDEMTKTDAAPKPRLIKGPGQIKADKESRPTAPSEAETVAPFAPKTVGMSAPNSSPVLKILYPEDQSLFHTDQIKLKYQLLAGNSSDSTKIVVMVDGQRQPATRAVRAANTIDVDLPRHDCTVMMYAQNKNCNSEPATIRLIRETTSLELPKLFVVAIGVGDYNDPKLPKLKYTCKDAQDFAKAIAAKKGLPYEEVEVKLLCDSEASRADIFEAMEWLKQEASPTDVCIFFFAGHGMKDEKDRFYFMPYGCNTDKLYECFSAADFRSEAEDIHGKLIAFIDACYSGGLFEGGRSAATTHFIEQLKRAKNGILLYASSSSDTKSREDESWGNGAFTKALVEALNGAAREEHTEGLSTQELEHFLYKEVRKLTDFKQTPIFINPNGIEHFNIYNYEK